MQKKDEAYLFAMSLVDQLRRLTPYQLAVAKQKFHGILIEAEFTMPSAPTLTAPNPNPQPATNLERQLGNPDAATNNQYTEENGLLYQNI